MDLIKGICFVVVVFFLPQESLKQNMFNVGQFNIFSVSSSHGRKSIVKADFFKVQNNYRLKIVGLCFSKKIYDFPQVLKCAKILMVLCRYIKCEKGHISPPSNNGTFRVRRYYSSRCSVWDITL